jgi:hypothetical protein
MGRLILALAAASMAACTSITLDPAPPPGYDLSGTWVLVEDASEAPPSRRRLRAQGGMLTFITRDFPVLTTQRMQIEQGPASMGISYGVGSYRDVTWGTRRRGLWEVRAGWHEGTLMILSEASDATASEVFTLSADGQRLSIEVVIRSGGDDVSLTRVFRRD